MRKIWKPENMPKEVKSIAEALNGKGASGVPTMILRSQLFAELTKHRTLPDGTKGPMVPPNHDFVLNPKGIIRVFEGSRAGNAVDRFDILEAKKPRKPE